VHIECVEDSQIHCSVDPFTEAFNVITWKTTLMTPAELATGAKSFTGTRTGPGDATVQATVCYGAVCTVSNMAFLPSGSYNPGLVITHEQACVGFPPGFTVSLYFGGWNPGDPVPTGSVTLEGTGIEPMQTHIIPIQPNAYAGYPGGSASFFFETPGTMTITGTYAGDGVWPSAFTQSIAPSEGSCGV
jgi:hypothetical protein